jgi:hypothetical protein
MYNWIILRDDIKFKHVLVILGRGKFLLPTNIIKEEHKDISFVKYI